MNITRRDALKELRQRWQEKESRLPWFFRRTGRRLAYRGFSAALLELANPVSAHGVGYAERVDKRAADAAVDAVGMSPLAWFILSTVVQLLLPILREWIFEKKRQGHWGNDGLIIVGPVEPNEVKSWSD